MTVFVEAGLALGAVAIRHLRCAKAPLIDLRALGIRSFAVTLGACPVIGFLKQVFHTGTRHVFVILYLAPEAQILHYSDRLLGGGSLFRMSVAAVPFLLPLMFQLAFGLDAFISGLLVLAVFGGSLGMKVVTTRALRRFGFRQVLLVNGAVTTLTILGLRGADARYPLLPPMP